MANKNGIATIREDKFNKGLVEKLQLMAIADGGRSLNNFLLKILSSYIKTTTNEQNAGQTLRGTNHSEDSGS